MGCTLESRPISRMRQSNILRSDKASRAVGFRSNQVAIAICSNRVCAISIESLSSIEIDCSVPVHGVATWPGSVPGSTLRIVFESTLEVFIAVIELYTKPLSHLRIRSSATALDTRNISILLSGSLQYLAPGAEMARKSSDERDSTESVGRCSI